MFNKELLPLALELVKAKRLPNYYCWALLLLSDIEIFKIVSNELQSHEEAKKKITEAFDNGTNLINLNELFFKFKNYKQIFEYLRDYNV